MNNLLLDETPSYARILTDGTYRTDELLTTHFSKVNSIAGGYYWHDTEGFNNSLGFNTDLSWNWNYNNLDIDTDSSAFHVYSEYKSEYIDDFKTAIANILLNGTASGKTYETAVNEITKLGFNETDKANIK